MKKFAAQGIESGDLCLSAAELLIAGSSLTPGELG
jgi:hypothetical protein